MMETILVIAFGCKFNIQGGEADELTKVAKIVLYSIRRRTTGLQNSEPLSLSLSQHHCYVCIMQVTFL